MPKKKNLTRSQLKKIAAEDALPVDRAFLRDLANTIYNSRNRTYLRLCNGTLQNGPDPKNPSRPMHCGLGELYFAMTGFQPDETGVREVDVVKLATSLSSVKEKFDDDVNAAKNAIEALDVPRSVKESMLMMVDDAAAFSDYVDDDDCGEMADDLVQFRKILNEIPEENDQGGSDASCSLEDYKDRSIRVATALREAAKLLPW